ncbi:MAG: PorT family protein [Acidobacteria bacterium]|nr:PorT family protein [Acidobacteriota bacterium]
MNGSKAMTTGKAIVRMAIVFFSATVPSFAQLASLNLGVKVGVPATDAFDKGTSVSRLTYFSDTKRYTLGPTLELNLPHRLGIEFDALYKRLDYGFSATSIDLITNTATNINSWEFPLLLKYRLSDGSISPFIDAGVNFHHVSGVTHVVSQIVGTNRETGTSEKPQELRDSSNSGFVIGIGFQLGSGLIRLSPEIRYTRWGSTNFEIPSGIFGSNLNQAEFLLGITFGR